MLSAGCEAESSSTRSVQSETTPRIESQPQPSQHTGADSSPFTFLQSKTEPDGDRNVMELYALSGKFDRLKFRELCKQKKSGATAEAFTYIVLFDKAANAAFPNSPFTAMFGLEEEKIKHIIAVFEYNKKNGFCEMTTYNPNMWEGKAKREKL
jgi:hypothetical protein